MISFFHVVLVIGCNGFRPRITSDREQRSRRPGAKRCTGESIAAAPVHRAGFSYTGTRRGYRGAGCARRDLGGRRAGVVAVVGREGNGKTVGGEVVEGGGDRVGEMERRSGWEESEKRAVFLGFGRNEEDRAWDGEL